MRHVRRDDLRLGDGVERPRPWYSISDTCVNGSSRAPNRLVVLRMPLATARTLPEPWVMIVTILSASPSLMDRRTTPCSL